MPADGWSVNVSKDTACFLYYGAYVTCIPTDKSTARFRLLVDNVSANNSEVVVVDVYDATTGTVLARRAVTRTEFNALFVFEGISLPSENINFGHRVGFRT